VIPVLSEKEFLNELKVCDDKLQTMLFQNNYLKRFQPDDIKEAATLYLKAGGKRLRPAILMWSCGAVDGDLKKALPAACAVEIFHTWTLVHDDIIDRDSIRRGSKTVHRHFNDQALINYKDINEEDARHYGTSVAILAGDVQHGWNVSLLTELFSKHGISSELTLKLIYELNTFTINELIEGELLDLQYSCKKPGEVTAEQIEEMLWKKTGVLYRFCAKTGAMLGLNTTDENHPWVSALADFAGNCGIAFQLQDDILGVTGDPAVTGKPVGNDIREGKQTTVLLHGWANANQSEREIISSVLGNSNASENSIQEAISILENRGGIETTKNRADGIIKSLYNKLDVLPQTHYKTLLRTWADYLVKRDL